MKYPNGIFSLIKLLSNNKFYVIQEIFLDKYAINKVVEFNKDKLITCSYGDIKIWEKGNDNYIYSNTKKINDDESINILKIKENKLISCEEKSLYFGILNIIFN